MLPYLTQLQNTKKLKKKLHESNLQFLHFSPRAMMKQRKPFEQLIQLFSSTVTPVLFLHVPQSRPTIEKK